MLRKFKQLQFWYWGDGLVVDNCYTYKFNKLKQIIMNIYFNDFYKNIYYKVSDFILDSIIKLASNNEHYADENIKILMPDWLEELIKKTVLSEVENLGNKGAFTFYGHDVFPNYENKLIVYSIKFNKDEPKQFFELDLKSLFNE